MSFEANLVELHSIFLALSQENEALRALLADYEQWREDSASGKMGFIHIYPAFRGQWQERRDRLKERYDALLKGTKP